MPLLDHFHPPFSTWWPWEGIHGSWATFIAQHLNRGLLPAEYYAMPLVQIGGRVEVDIATLRGPDRPGTAEGPGTAVWAPPQPTLDIPIEAAGADSFEVQVFRDFGGPQLRAAIELVSPSNKDRPASRHAFAGKCAGYLRRGVSMIVVDVVTSRTADMHAEILRALEPTQGPGAEPTAGLFAASYRVLAAEPPRLVAWSESLAIGAALPTLPLWVEPDLGVPLALEESYAQTCESLRLRA